MANHHHGLKVLTIIWVAKFGNFAHNLAPQMSFCNYKMFAFHFKLKGLTKNTALTFL
jgi:hypothetical protein